MSRLSHAQTMHRPKAAVRAGLGLSAALGLALSLSACAAPPLSTFDLSAPTTDLKARVPSAVLAVPEPSAPAPADSDRIMVRTGGSVAVVRGAQWSERLPRLLQSRLIQTFENAKLVKSVSRPGDGASPDRALAWDVRRFEVDTTDGLAKVEISVRLLDSTGKILAAQIFVSSVPGEAGEGAQAAQALDEASHQVLRQIVTWAASRM